jgi:alkanesulfonate monooxygenase SsuD/methylene tetrahydromethanopterin reductase-like flavin-dependent oxidoreductase (luciferase family)
MFGKSLKDRAKLMDSGIELILRALRGERFDVDGRPVYVRPLPVQSPEDIILVGGGVAASARRAARFELGYFPIRSELIDVYLDECRKLGQQPSRYIRPQPGSPLSIHLCEDPDEGWAAIERHAVHVITEYAKLADQEGDGSTSPFKDLLDPSALRQAGLFAPWTPQQLLDKVPDMLDNTTFGFQPLLGGLSPEEGWKSMKLLQQTMPELKAAIAARA